MFETVDCSRARRSEDEARRVVEALAERPFLGLIGETRVNVLQLKLAVDRLRSS